MAINTVLFDFGNVFTMWDPELVLLDSNGGPYSREVLGRFYEDVNWYELIEAWDGGELHSSTLARIEEVDARLGTNYAQIYTYYIPRFKTTIANQVPQMADLVRDLQAVGIHTYGLTNWSSEDIGPAKECVDGIGLMEDIVVSGVEKVVKPMPEIYQIAIDRFGLTPENTVFVDDKQENIDAWKEFGGNGYVFPAPFEDAQPGFRKYLQSLGVPI
jgi:HAD superfamily hydrolase (TIGR01509 family)